jgi:hypothetical protein
MQLCTSLMHPLFLLGEETTLEFHDQKKVFKQVLPGRPKSILHNKK